MKDKCNCYRFSPRDSLSGAVAQIADYLSKHPGWNETELRAFIDGLISHTGVESFNGRTGVVTLDKNDVNNLNIASAYFAKGDESIDSLNLVSLYNNGVRFVFADFNNETKSYNLSFVLDYSDSGNVVYYPISADSIAGDNVISVNGKTGKVELKVVDVSNGNSSDKNAYIFIDESEDYPDIVAADSNKLGGQNPQYYATTESVTHITPDDTVVDGKPWTSKKIVDTLCMPIESTGNPVQVYPVEGYPLGVKVSLEPVQAGSGDPSPDNIRPITGRDSVSVMRCGKNLLDYNGTITILKDIYYYESYDKNDPLIIASNKLPKGVSLVMTADWSYYTTTAVHNRISFVLEDNSILSFNKGVPNTIPADRDIVAVLIYAGQDKTQDSIVSNICFSLGTADYEPYAGSTTDIALPETVYGGTLDLETGVVTVVNKYIELMVSDMNNSDDNYPGWTNQNWITDCVPIGYNGTIVNAMCNIYNKVSAKVSSTSKIILFPTGFPLTQSEMIESYPDLIVQFVIPLIEPYTIQLTPQQIAALSGANTIYADAGTLTVAGREDPRHTITELRNAIISLGGNV